VEKLRRIEALHARPGSVGETAGGRTGPRTHPGPAEKAGGGGTADRIPPHTRRSVVAQSVRGPDASLWHPPLPLPRPAAHHRDGPPQPQLCERHTLWPEFLELQSTLVAFFDALTDRVIEQALEVKAGEAEEQQQAAPQLPLQDHQGSLL
jgi:hypothetical protein